MTFLHRTLLILALTARLVAEPTRLELGKTVEAELAGGQTHQYVVTMGAGQFMRIVVSRPGFATVARLSGTLQESSLELHWPGAAGRPESFCWTTNAPGDNRFELAAVGNSAAEKYSVTLQELRPTLTNDEKHIEVQQLFESARSAYGQKKICRSNLGMGARASLRPSLEFARTGSYRA